MWKVVTNQYLRTVVLAMVWLESMLFGMDYEDNLIVRLHDAMFIG